MKVQNPTMTPATDVGNDSVDPTALVPTAPLPEVDKKNRDKVLSEIAEDSLVAPRDYLRDSVACTGE